MENLGQEHYRRVIAYKNRTKNQIFFIITDEIAVYFNSPPTRMIFIKCEKAVSVNMQGAVSIAINGKKLQFLFIFNGKP